MASYAEVAARLQAHRVKSRVRRWYAPSDRSGRVSTWQLTALGSRRIDQHGYGLCLLILYDQIRLAVLIDIDHSTTADIFPTRLHGLQIVECSVSAITIEGDLRTARPCTHDVQISIPVEVDSERHNRIPSSGVTYGLIKCAIAFVEKDGEIVVPIGDLGQIQLSVPIEIR